MIDWNFVEIMVGLFAFVIVIGHIGERVQQMIGGDEE